MSPDPTDTEERQNLCRINVECLNISKKCLVQKSSRIISENVNHRDCLPSQQEMMEKYIQTDRDRK